MGQTLRFAEISWEICIKINKLNRGYFQFYVNEVGEHYLGIYTKKWVPDKTKCSPRHCNYHDKYLCRNLSRISFWEQKELVDRLIRLGYKPKSEEEIQS